MNCRQNWMLVCLEILFALQPNGLEAGVWPLTLLQNAQQTAGTAQRLEDATPIATTIAHRFAGYIEYQPNGTIVLRSNSLQNDSNLQNLMLFKTILKTIKLAAPYARIDVGPGAVATDAGGSFNIKIYGDGVEHKFPPFLERFIQRIQTYFSVYRYTDTSRPVRQQTTTPNYDATTVTDGDYLTTTYSSHGYGGGGDNHYSNDAETTTFLDDNTAGYEGTTEDYNEFIAIDEDDGYISVGED